MADGAGWLDERAKEWTNRGFDGPLLVAQLKKEGGNLSEAVLHLESRVERAEWLVGQVRKFPVDWTERAEILESLRDPATIEANERRWRELVRSRRPWHAVADAARSRWAGEGRTQELANWLERLDRIDPSMIPQSTELLASLENTARTEAMEAVVSELEERQIQRVHVLEEMVAHLRVQRGWSLSGLSGNLQERYAEVGRIQDLDAILMAIEEVAGDGISIYDPEAAISLVQRAEFAQNMEDEGRLTELLEKSRNIAADYEERLQKITDWLTDLDERQLHLNAPRPPTPGDLLVLESKVGVVADAVTRLGEAWLRLDGLLDLFPEHAGEAAALQGQVELVAEVERLVEVLQAMRDENDSRARGRLHSWAASGFEVEPFEVLLSQRPSLGWTAVEEHAERVKVCKEVLSNVDLLDISYAGADEVAGWNEVLRAASVDHDDVTKVQKDLTKRLRRNGLHREQLDKARLKMAGSWPTGLSVGSLSLAEYEEVVTALQAGRAVPGHFEKQQSSARDLRLREVAQGEVDLWRTSGWDVSGLDKMFERAPTELWASLPAFREAMDEFDHLRERLHRLPLNRSSDILNSVDADLRRPDKLQGLSDSLPSLAAELSALPTTADEHLFNLFGPTLVGPFAKLYPVYPTLTPSAPEVEEVEEMAAHFTPDSEGVATHYNPDSEEMALPIESSSEIRKRLASLGKQDTVLAARDRWMVAVKGIGTPRSGSTQRIASSPARRVGSPAQRQARGRPARRVGTSEIPRVRRLSDVAAEDPEQFVETGATEPPALKPGFDYPSHTSQVGEDSGADLLDWGTADVLGEPFGRSPPGGGRLVREWRKKYEPAEILRPVNRPVLESKPKVPETRTPAEDIPKALIPLPAKEEQRDPEAEEEESDEQVEVQVQTEPAPLSVSFGDDDEVEEEALPYTPEEPVAEETEPVVEKFEPVEEMPQPVVHKPKPVVEKSVPIYEKPREVTRPIDPYWDGLMLRIGGTLDDKPRDVRVQRLARLMILLEPNDADSDGEALLKSELTKRLDKIAERLEKWTKQRLVHRNSSTVGSLLRLSARLANRLNDIPGPGSDLPMQPDEGGLPTTLDHKELEDAISLLENSTRVPYAGGKPMLATAA